MQMKIGLREDRGEEELDIQDILGIDLGIDGTVHRHYTTILIIMIDILNNHSIYS